MTLEKTRMIEATVEAHFSSGHYLRNYHGRCENLRGHNYRTYITLIGEDGLLLDFK
jgi:6-pyruvoyltetrahydropterin/6-carboxytetrahydropterin synthase